MHTRQRIALFLPAVLLIACRDQPAPTATADDQARLTAATNSACAQRVNNTVDKLLGCVTLDGVRSHQAALQAIADANGGTRVSGSAGYDQSAEYVANTLRSAGYDVTVQPFQFQTFITLSPTVLEQVAPAPTGPIAATIMTYSGSGDITAPVTEIPRSNAPPDNSNAGCNAADFAGFPAGSIALIERGFCSFASKATNARSAGASAVVIYNREPGAFSGTLDATFTLNIPVVAVTQAAGQQFAATPGLLLRVKTDTYRGVATTSNVFAETRDGDVNNVVMVGAHLDAVDAGAGIQDNGTGSAAILETALQMARVKPRNKVRFAWWGAEESGRVGSTYYVNNLAHADLNRIALYLNFDMIGSPNHVFFVLDGDDSDNVGAGAGPVGSAAIEGLFESFYRGRSLPFKGSDFSGGSDYAPFIAAGVPSGGLFTGADGVKTAAEAFLWGGTAGQQYDPCYHLACDTYANVNPFALDVNADAVAFATLSLAMNTSQVNGGKAKGNFKANGSGPGNSAHATLHE